MPALAAIRETGAVKALAHITGGGLLENLPRVLPGGLAAAVDLASWTAPAVFGWLQRAGRLDTLELVRTFNVGIGLVIVAASDKADAVLANLKARGEAASIIGEITTGGHAKTQAKGKGTVEAVRLSGRLRYAA
jgi:phosphoribosylformylglycinamidine cyclo-ligase